MKLISIHLRAGGVEGVDQLARLLEVRQLVEVALILRLRGGDDSVKNSPRVKLDLFHHGIGIVWHQSGPTSD